MNSSNMKNIVVLNNLPSNIIEEAIVILKENKKIKKYQYSEKKKTIDVQNVEKTKQKSQKDGDKIKPQDYILKEAEMIITNYISELEKKTPKWNKDMKQLEIKYKKSIKMNLFLAFATAISLWMTFFLK